MPLLDGLAAPFAPVSESMARSVLSRFWGLQAGELTRLDTERDDTFRVSIAGGDDVLIKIAHPKDPPAEIAMQSAILEHIHATDASIPVQRVVPTRAGASSTPIGGQNPREARVLTWLDGDLLLDSASTPSLLTETGRMLGRLDAALESFHHEGAHRALSWDLKQLPDLRSHATDPLHLEIIDRFEATVSPVLADLPHQVIHNDGHPGNVLVAEGRLTGILDFGDAVSTARVCNLAVSLAYLVPDAPRPWPDVDAFTAGYLETRPLRDDELALLPMLIAARTILRSVINQVLHRDQHDDPHGFYARNDRKLQYILEEG